MFGQTNKPAFGASRGFGTQNGGTGFDTTNVFSSQTPGANTSGLFSSNAAQPGSVFGAGTNSTFGQNTVGAGFGSQSETSKIGLFNTTSQLNSSLFSTPASTGFGDKSASTAAFGSTVPSVGGLSTPASTSLFGSTNPTAGNTARSVFGSSKATSFVGQLGTTIQFNPAAGQDSILKGGVSTSISTKHQCITAMKEYETKCLEELRLEDYLANRKGPQPGSSALCTASEAAQAQAAFSFAAQSKPSAFGGFSKTTAPGGTSLFSQPQQTQSGGLFGSTVNKTSFGITAAATTSGFGGFGASGGQSVFGQNIANKSLLGQPTTTQNGGLFGSTQTASPALSGFGSTQTGFGASTQTGGLFGNKTTSFAQPVSSTGLAFGQPNTALSSGGLFASKPTGPANTGINFGQTTATGFGTAVGGLFSNKPSGFGAVSSTLGATGFGQVGAGLGSGLNTGLAAGVQNRTAVGGLSTAFGNTTGLNLSNPGLIQNTANVTALSTPAISLQNQEAEIINQLKKSLSYSPYGDSPLFRNLDSTAVSKEDLVKPTNPLAQKAALASHNQYKVSPRPTARIKPKVLNVGLKDKSQLFDGLEEEDLSFGNITFVPRRSVKKLTIKSNGSFSKTNSLIGTPEFDTVQNPCSPQTPDVGANGRQPVTSTSKTEGSPRTGHMPSTSNSSPKKLLFQNIGESFLEDTFSDVNNQTPNGDKTTHDEMSSPPKSWPAGVILSRHGYYTVPSLDELVKVVDETGNCTVDDFVVGREGYGYVMFPGQTNIANLNLDEIVHFRRKEITIYPNDEQKPPVGSGLNKKAQVTLHCVWPCDEKTHDYIKDAECLAELQYEQKLERISSKIGAKFLDYKPETGSWVFEVKHFSKYGLLEEEDEDDVLRLNSKKLSQLQKQQQQQLAIQKQQIKVSPAQPPTTDADNAKEVEQCMDKQSVQTVEVKSDTHHYHPLMMDEDFQGDTKKNIPDNYNKYDETESLERAPTSHQLASHIGVMAEDLQLRKASFFAEDDFKPRWKDSVSVEEKNPLWQVGRSLLSANSTSARFVNAQPATAPRLLTTTINKTNNVIDEDELALYESVQPSVRIVTKPKPTKKSYFRRKMPRLDQSLFANKQTFVMDLGLFHAKQFRVGWGPSWNLVQGGKLLADTADNLIPAIEGHDLHSYILLPKKNHALKTQTATDEQVLQIKQLLVIPTAQTAPYKSLVHQAVIDHLNIQLQQSQISAEFGCPQAVPNVGNGILQPLITCVQTALDDLDDSFERGLYKQSLLVWELCQALWGDIDDLFIEDGYSHHVARQQAFSTWMMKAVSSTVHNEVEHIKAEFGSEAAIIFQYLTGHQLEEACEFSQQNGDHHLALLIAQASKTNHLCHYIQQQLAIWAQQKMDKFIKPDRLKIYTLLTGTPIWTTSTGQTVNVCEGLDWKRAMAIHLWYMCQPTCTIADAMAAYYHTFSEEQDQCYAAPPLPSYLEASMMTEDKYDICYQLIRLFCERSYPLHKLLTPTSVTPNSLDHRLSWQLSQVLQALGYTHLSEYHSAMLCTSFAAQLETMGLWYWAVFVLMHIPDQRDREHAIMEMLYHHISLYTSEEEQEQEQFLQDVLKIPSQWLHQAKAVKAGYHNQKDKEAWHWLKAENWNKAHQLVVKHLAAEAIVNENFNGLKYFLNELASPDVCCTIEDWNKGGCVFLDYITMMETLQQLQQSEPSILELDKLQSEVCELSRHIIGLKCHTATDRLCQSEMAKRAANLMRTLLQMKGNENDINEMLVNDTTDLPLPEDYALQELHQLTRCYMLCITMS